MKLGEPRGGNAGVHACARGVPDNPVVLDLVDRAEKREGEGFDAFRRGIAGALAGEEGPADLEEYVGTPAAAVSGQSMEQIIQQLEAPPRRIPGRGRTAARKRRQAPASPARFVTATLAEIYASQGNMTKPIEAYRTLAVQRPGSAERYQTAAR